MYDEVMQLIALAKNDEQYFKRIEELKQKQLEVAHVLEIASTLKDADMHLAKARQESTEILEAAHREALVIKESAITVISENKSLLEKNKVKAQALKDRENILQREEEHLKALEKTMKDSIEEHRKLTEDRSIEQEAAKKVKLEFETKLKKLKEIAAT